MRRWFSRKARSAGRVSLSSSFSDDRECSSCAEKPAKCLQVDRVHVLVVAFDLRRLQHHRPVAKTRIVDQQAKRLDAEMSAANMSVAINPAAVRLEAVVDVKRLQARQTDEPIEGAKRGAILRFGGECIAGREDVAGVQTDAEPAR